MDVSGQVCVISWQQCCPAEDAVFVGADGCGRACMRPHAAHRSAWHGEDRPRHAAGLCGEPLVRADPGTQLCVVVYETMSAFDHQAFFSSTSGRLDLPS